MPEPLSVPCSNRMAEAVAGASANSQALPTLKTSSLSSILTILPVRKITFIESVEQGVGKKLVLKEANQVINPKLLELADSKSGGYGRHRGGRNRWRSRGGRNGKDRSYSRSRSRSHSREYNGRGNRRSYSRSYSRSRSPVSNRADLYVYRSNR